MTVSSNSAVRLEHVGKRFGDVVALVLIVISVVPVYIAQRLASDVTGGAGLW